ncbi:unnamed protein product [Dovyalis caffra]|uniref:Uncharacterized protein n=1 Tax=Dovyalis caffra TaxID=77055 RepID=A0AAV1S7J4_9ROSI|nr:unnamed protein product [Dovyalis caffra]
MEDVTMEASYLSKSVTGVWACWIFTWWGVTGSDDMWDYSETRVGQNPSNHYWLHIVGKGDPLGASHAPSSSFSFPSLSLQEVKLNAYEHAVANSFDQFNGRDGVGCKLTRQAPLDSRHTYWAMVTEDLQRSDKWANLEGLLCFAGGLWWLPSCWLVGGDLDGGRCLFLVLAGTREGRGCGCNCDSGRESEEEMQRTAEFGRNKEGPKERGKGNKSVGLWSVEGLHCGRAERGMRLRL